MQELRVEVFVEAVGIVREGLVQERFGRKELVEREKLAGIRCGIVRRLCEIRRSETDRAQRCGFQKATDGGLRDVFVEPGGSCVRQLLACEFLIFIVNGIALYRKEPREILGVKDIPLVKIRDDDVLDFLVPVRDVFFHEIQHHFLQCFHIGAFGGKHLVPVARRLDFYQDGGLRLGRVAVVDREVDAPFGVHGVIGVVPGVREEILDQALVIFLRLAVFARGEHPLQISSEYFDPFHGHWHFYEGGIYRFLQFDNGNRIRHKDKDLRIVFV